MYGKQPQMQTPFDIYMKNQHSLTMARTSFKYNINNIPFSYNYHIFFSIHSPYIVEIISCAYNVRIASDKIPSVAGWLVGLFNDNFFFRSFLRLERGKKRRENDWCLSGIFGEATNFMSFEISDFQPHQIHVRWNIFRDTEKGKDHIMYAWCMLFMWACILYVRNLKEWAAGKYFESI